MLGRQQKVKYRRGRTEKIKKEEEERRAMQGLKDTTAQNTLCKEQPAEMDAG
jgi:hypothetical protein